MRRKFLILNLGDVFRIVFWRAVGALKTFLILCSRTERSHETRYS
ncbi:hypothetical protein PYK22_00579 [Pyrinomonas methylaliphatogenes]|uniref:Uncharacterized protein n=1 Tax=Pyrinomonas methylaliphatogenes TaxID=454194 RepID=A0A0B6WWT8_9BACT|nr:hypothetical protein PYK22_00579 [Pyrinomonas methylaliphatogenes]